MRLEGKVALVTGAATGIKGEVMGFGGATAWLFAREGAKVVQCDVNDEMGEESASQIRATGADSLFVHLDVTDEHAWIDAIQTAVSHFGKLDSLVNNAGFGAGNGFEETTVEEWDSVMDVNAKAAFLGIKHAVPEMCKVGGGTIVNMSSIHGIAGAPRSPAYTAGKAAIRNLTKSAAIGYAQENIRVNSIHPGNSLTPRLLARRPDGRYPEAEKKVPMGRLGQAEEVANGILFLACDESSFMTGAELVVDGGFLAQ